MRLVLLVCELEEESNKTTAHRTPSTERMKSRPTWASKTKDEKQHMQRALNGVFSMCVCACARVFVHVCTCVHISLSLSICVCFCGDRRTG